MGWLLSTECIQSKVAQAVQAPVFAGGNGAQKMLGHMCHSCFSLASQ